jgi:flagella basal body P-ring formation protein FlgA
LAALVLRLAFGAALSATLTGAPRPALAERIAVDPDSIRARIEAVWLERGIPQATLEIRALPVLHYEGGQVRLEVAFPDGVGRPGPRAIPVTVCENGRTVARGLANVMVRASRAVWIVTRPLARGDPLSADALRREERVFESEPLRLFEWQGERTFRLARQVSPGTLLTTTDVWPLPHVAAGSEILLLSRAGSASVSIPAKARTSGDLGSVILVANPVTGKLVRARVLDAKTAVLETPLAESGSSKGAS